MSSALAHLQRLQRSFTHQVFQLATSLLDNAILATEDDAHPREVLDLCRAHDERVDVEATRGEDARDARQDARLVLHEAVERMSRERLQRGRRSCTVSVSNQLDAARTERAHCYRGCCSQPLLRSMLAGRQLAEAEDVSEGARACSRLPKSTKAGQAAAWASSLSLMLARCMLCCS